MAFVKGFSDKTKTQITIFHHNFEELLQKHKTPTIFNCSLSLYHDEILPIIDYLLCKIDILRK